MVQGKFAWLVASCLLVVILAFASCGPSATIEGEQQVVKGKVQEQTTPATTPTTPVVQGIVPGAVVKQDVQYGGTLTIVANAPNPDKFDPIQYSSAQESYFTGFYFESLLVGDLSKGNRGTSEYWFCDSYWVPDPYIIGSLAESWEWSGPLTVRFKLRHGVYFPSKPGIMSSREMTSADVVFSLKRLIDAKATLGTRYEWMGSVSAVDKYTVDLTFVKFSADWLWRMTSRGTAIIPSELVTAGIEEWKNLVGTGPFVLKDFVKGSSMTLEKNPTYWGKTTINGKEYQLPFINRYVIAMVADESTRVAALRSGKTDILAGVTWQNRASLAQNNPQLKVFKRLTGGPSSIAMRLDTAPFNDIKVRRAMNMAINRKEITDAFLGGESVPLSFPFSLEWGPEFFTPLESYPADVQEAYQYNPEKAKQLLKEAGYPDGIKTNMVFSSLSSITGDLASMLASQWAKVGITVELKPTEQGAFVGLIYAKKHTGLVLNAMSNSSPISVLRNMGEPGDPINFSIFDNAGWYAKFLTTKEERDVVKQAAGLKALNYEWNTYLAHIQMPTGYTYLYAQPWVNNYFGETNCASLNSGLIIGTVWLDQTMKAQMGK